MEDQLKEQANKLQRYEAKLKGTSISIKYNMQLRYHHRIQKASGRKG